jgi:hypothetical protein
MEKQSPLGVLGRRNIPKYPGARHMGSFRCIPRSVYEFLYKFTEHLRYIQAQHFLVYCWFLIALVRDPGKRMPKGLGAYLPPKLY